MMFKGLFTGLLGGVGIEIDQALGTGNFVPHFRKGFSGQNETYIPKNFNSELEAKEAFRREHHREPEPIYPGSKEWK